MDTRKRSLRSILIVVVATLTMATGISTANAAPKEKPKVLVLYSENRGVVRVDTNEPGIDDGDLFHREIALSRTFNGPVIGVSYSQAEVISHDPESNVDVRRVLMENFLPKGRMFFIGTSELDRGAVPAPGWTNSYAILGGTGIYAGARGTMKLVVLADGKSWKSTATYTLN